MDKLKLKTTIITYLEEKALRPLLKEELRENLSLQEKDFTIFDEVLSDLEKDALVIKNRHDFYGLPSHMNLVVGILSMTAQGFGFVCPSSDKETDVFIAKGLLGTAMHGDEVVARLLPSNTQKKLPEGEIIRIIKRKNLYLVGTFAGTKSFAFVTPDDKKISQDIFIAKDDTLGAVSNEKVVVKIIKWPSPRRSAEGKVVEILGKRGDKGVDIISIMRQYDLVEEFPTDVLKEAQDISQKILKKDLKGRVDRRDLPLVTIDGADAKDLDDAIFARKNEDGTYLVGIYIADVSHYVKENTALDKEAQKRGTSVYLVDRVLPMLPKELSNGICSLNAGENRLAFALELNLNRQGEVLDYRIFQAIILVKNRLTYEAVDAYLEGKTTGIVDTNMEVENLIDTALKVRNLRKKKRLARGAIDFDLPEIKVTLGEDGKPTSLEKHTGTLAESIIEEFMLLANETIAEHLVKADIPSVYRVHERPTEEKITEFNNLLAMFGEHIHIKSGAEVVPKEIARVLKKVTDRVEERLIKTIALRTMQQARYTRENLGHFALAARYYTHFTSPIRRYSDLLVHRYLKELLVHGKMTKKRRAFLEENLPEVTRHLSERERVAIDAERATTDLKKVEYMTKFTGEEFRGIISSVTNFGIFVELSNGVEGLVHVSSMVDDFYHFDREHYRLVGEHTGKIYHLGDEVDVILLKASIEDLSLDFVLKKNGMVKKYQSKKNDKAFLTNTLIGKGTVTHKKKKKGKKKKDAIIATVSTEKRGKKKKSRK